MRRTVLLGATQVHEGGVMMVRARDDIFRIEELKGKKIGLTKSLNTIKTDWWRIQEHAGIELMLRIHGMSMDDIELVEFPYPDDWYDKPEMLQVTMNNPSELWMRRDHKHDMAFRPLENALVAGKVDAIYNQSKPLQQLSEATGKIKSIEDLSRYPDWTMQMANCPAVITCTDIMADEHPELVIAYMKAMIKVGRWANRNKHAAAEILNRQTFYLDAEHTYEGIKHVDMVPSLSAQNMESIKIGKDFMVSHGYIKRDFDVDEWARPEFLEQAAEEVLKEEWEKRSWSKLPHGGGLEVEGVRLGSRSHGGGCAAGAADRAAASLAHPRPSSGRYEMPAHEVPASLQQNQPRAVRDAQRGLRHVEGRPGRGQVPRRAHLRGVRLRRPRRDGQERPAGLPEDSTPKARPCRAGRRRAARGSPTRTSSPR